MNSMDSRCTDLFDMNQRMIYNNDILFNTGFNDFWWVKWWKGEWVAVLLNDGQTESLKGLRGFAVCGEFNDFSEFKPTESEEVAE